MSLQEWTHFPQQGTVVHAGYDCINQQHIAMPLGCSIELKGIYIFVTKITKKKLKKKKGKKRWCTDLVIDLMKVLWNKKQAQVSWVTSPLRAHCQMLNSCTPLGKASGLIGEPTAAEVWLWTGATFPLRTSDSLSAETGQRLLSLPQFPSPTRRVERVLPRRGLDPLLSCFLPNRPLQAGAHGANPACVRRTGWSCRLCARALH